MNPSIRDGVWRLTGAITLLGCACNSNSDAINPSTGSGGRSQPAPSSRGGTAAQVSGAGGGQPQPAISSRGGQLGQLSSPMSQLGGSVSSTPRNATQTAGQIGQSAASGGPTGGASSRSVVGGSSATKTTAAVGGSGGGLQSGSASQPSGGTAFLPSAGAGGRSSLANSGSAGSAGVVAAAGRASNPRRVLLSDEGNRRVVLMDLQNPSANVWSRPLNDATKYGDGMRDMQLVGGERVAISVAKGYVELDLNSGDIKKEVTSFTGVESLRRLPSGNTVLGANSDGGVTLQELDPQDKPISGRKATFTGFGQNLRLLRRTPEGSFLLGVGSKLAEVNWDKQILWEMSIPNGDWVFQGLKIDKHISVTSGYGAEILIIEPTTKKVLTAIGGKSQPDAATVAPNFYCGFQVLSNGHYVVTNWQGHGAGNGSKGIQLLEYDASGTLVWQWKQDPKLVSSLHGVLVLDGLDTSKLHDDVNGVLAPAAQ